MKTIRNTAIILIIILIAITAGCSSDTDGVADAAVENTKPLQDDNTTDNDNISEQDTGNAEVKDSDFGARSALTKQDLAVEDMLRYAIEDEYLARQEYQSVMENFGEQRPFSNIINSEKTHIELLKGLYNDYGYDIPKDNAIEYLVVPQSLEEAFEVGVKAEIDNIAMYEKFLQQDLPDDVRGVFIQLRDASRNHLSAFEKGPRGVGGGNGSGRNNQ